MEHVKFLTMGLARSKFTLKVKEALQISWLKPTLNKKIDHLSVTIN